jgi:hypothetical protein
VRQNYHGGEQSRTAHFLAVAGREERGKEGLLPSTRLHLPIENDEIIVPPDAILPPAGDQAFSTQAFWRWVLHVQPQHPQNLSSVTVLMSKGKTMSTLHSGVRSI